MIYISICILICILVIFREFYHKLSCGMYFGNQKRFPNKTQPNQMLANYSPINDTFFFILTQKEPTLVCFITINHPVQLKRNLVCEDCSHYEHFSWRHKINFHQRTFKVLLCLNIDFPLTNCSLDKKIAVYLCEARMYRAHSPT